MTREEIDAMSAEEKREHVELARDLWNDTVAREVAETLGIGETANDQ